MNGRLTVFLIVILALLTFSEAATLHGTVYDSSLNMIKNAQLEINTTPKQSHISKNGVYFFYVPLGTYEISAEKYYQGKLIYHSKKLITVTKDGEFNIDIVVETLPGVEIPPFEEDVGPSLWNILRARLGYLFYVAIAFVLILILGLVVFLYLRYGLKNNAKNKIIKSEVVGETSIAQVNTSDKIIEEKPEPKEAPSEDIEGVLKIIREEGGRTTQKDIRKRIPLSEAKISLMVSELEAKGKIQKIKKGRGNIIILK